MAEHQALISLHHEVIRPPEIQHLPSYRFKAEVGKQVAHNVSDHLSGRTPYPQPAKFDRLQPTIAHGKRGVTKTVEVLQELVDIELEEVDDDERQRVANLKRDNVSKLFEAIYDITVIGDAVANTSEINTVALLKQLLADPDPQVRTGAAQVLGRFCAILQGRKAVCASGCAEQLAFMLEDPEHADVRLASGKTLHILTQSIDGRDDVVDTVADGQTILIMVKALLAVSQKQGGISTPELTPVLLDALANLLRFDEPISLALMGGVMPFVVQQLKLRKHNMAALRCLCSICSHPEGKRAAIEEKALQAICGLLASEKPVERQLSARAVLLMCVDELGKQKAGVLVPNLCQQLYEEDHDLYMNALLAIRTICEWPATREYVMKVLEDDPEMREQVFSDHQVHLASYRYEANKPPRV